MVNFKIGQRVTIKANAKELTQKYLDWTNEMNSLTYRIGKVVKLDNLGRFASVQIDNKIYHFTTDSLLPYVSTSYKLHQLYKKYREQIRILSAWHDAKIKGKTDRKLQKEGNPYETDRERMAWEEGWKEQDELYQSQLQFTLVEKLFRDGRLNHQLMTLITERRWNEIVIATTEREIISRYVYVAERSDDSN